MSKRMVALLLALIMLLGLLPAGALGGRAGKQQSRHGPRDRREYDG